MQIASLDLVLTWVNFKRNRALQVSVNMVDLKQQNVLSDAALTGGHGKTAAKHHCGVSWLLLLTK